MLNLLSMHEYTDQRTSNRKYDVSEYSARWNSIRCVASCTSREAMLADYRLLTL